jgi:hypothetical protein
VQISTGQLLGIGASSEGQFAGSLMAQQAKSFPQISSQTQATPLATPGVQTAASMAVAQFHGFSSQQSIAVATTCVLPFVAGAAKAGNIQGEGAQSLQTLISDTQSVIAKLAVPSNASPLSSDQVAVLARQCAPLAASTGSSPLNIDRSGPVVPFTEQSPVKATDLVAPAASAVPPASSAPHGAITQEQMTAAAADVENNFPNTALGTIVQNCKPLVDLEFRRVYWHGKPIPNIPYTVTLSDGSTRSGTTDGNGLGSHTSVPPGPARVVYGENKNPAKSNVDHDVDDDYQKILSYKSSSGGSQS